jgi:hypothetical protein
MYTYVHPPNQHLERHEFTKKIPNGMLDIAKDNKMQIQGKKTDKELAPG